MKATGIVRGIDDIGRVVISKPLREQLGLKYGDPVEFFTDGNNVIIKKYVPEDEKNSSDTFDVEKEEIDYRENFQKCDNCFSLLNDEYWDRTFCPVCGEQL